MSTFDASDLDKLVEVARDTWEHAVGTRGADAEWLPKLMLWDDGGGVFVAGVGGLLDPDEEEVSTRDLAIAAAAELVRPTTAWIALTLDSYICGDRGTLFLVQHGLSTLREQYDRGNPNVIDCLFVYAMNRAGTAALRTMPYRRVRRHVEWLSDPAPTGEHELEGLVPDLLRAVMTRAAN